MSAYRVEIPAWADWYEAGATPARTQNSGAIGGGYLLSTNADAGYYGWQFACAAGTYTLFGLYVTGTTFAKFQMSIDGASVGSLTEGYAGSTAYNNVYSATSPALTEGVHTLRMTANGKHASATEYRLGAQWFSLERTGA